MSIYKTGKVYKIIHSQSDICYIGSTQNSLRDRWKQHKNDYSKSTHNLSIYEYFDKYGIEQFKIILIKEYSVSDKKELLALEQLWINKLKCINKYHAFQPLVKEYQKQYAIKNKEKISEYRKEYYIENRNKLLEIKKEYYNENKEHILEYQKEYYIENKEQIQDYKKEYFIKNKEQIAKHKAEYYQQNKKKVKNKVNEYRLKNREKINQKLKENYINNKDKINQRNKEYRLKNKNEINERRKQTYLCKICNQELRLDGKNRHEKSKSHQKNLSNKE